MEQGDCAKVIGVDGFYMFLKYSYENTDLPAAASIATSMAAKLDFRVVQQTGG